MVDEQVYVCVILLERPQSSLIWDAAKSFAFPEPEQLF